LGEIGKVLGLGMMRELGKQGVLHGEHGVLLDLNDVGLGERENGFPVVGCILMTVSVGGRVCSEVWMLICRGGLDFGDRGWWARARSRGGVRRRELVVWERRTGARKEWRSELVV
jgi:hypothetical protein